MTRALAALLSLSLGTTTLGCGESDPAAIPIDLVCDAPPAADPSSAVDLYLGGVTEPDPAIRPCLLQRSLAEEVVLVATDMHADGRPDVRVALDEAAEVRARDATARELVGEPLFRHREALIRWVLRDDTGVEFVRGEDWVEFAEDGRIARIHTAAGAGPEIPLSDELVAWERAWNLRDEAAQRSALEMATTEDVRFSDLLVDIEGRDAVLDEILRQQGLLDGTLDLGERVEVHATEEGIPVFVRHRATITNPGGAAIEILNFIRLRDGRIERLSGYPLTSL